MPGNGFSMQPQKQGRIKYLLLTMCPALVLMYLFQNLSILDILPRGTTWGLIYTSIPMAFMLLTGYFLIFRKNHQINVNNHTIVEINWLRKESCRIRSTQIGSVRTNALKEIILLDKDGNKLLCIESNMTNRDRFEQWLAEHNIEHK